MRTILIFLGCFVLGFVVSESLLQADDPLTASLAYDAVKNCNIDVVQRLLETEKEAFEMTVTTPIDVTHLVKEHFENAITDELYRDDIPEMKIQMGKPLHFGAIHGKGRCVKMLLDAGVNHSSHAIFNQGIYWGVSHKNTPLHFAVLAAQHDVIELLLDAGADPLASNDQHATPMGYAIALNRTDLFDQMIKRLPSHWHSSTPLGSTLLDAAVFNNNEYMVRELVKHGASPNWKGFRGKGDQPLFVAIEQNHAPMVKLLLELGADVAVVSDSHGLNVVQEAHRAQASDEIFKMLEKAHEDRSLPVPSRHTPPPVVGQVHPQLEIKTEL